MRLGERASPGEERVPRLASGVDPSTLPLSPAEGFLLSRIDGRTSCATLRQIGGLPPTEVERCLEQWQREGWIEFEGEAEGGPRRAAAAPAPPATRGGAPAAAALAVDERLAIPVETQREILAFAAGLARPYHEILGVARDADVRAIKKAYFRLSKVLHPDRYFRRETGAYGPLIERCFKKLLEAYELLSDPATRGEVQREEEAAAAAAAAPRASGRAPALSEAEARRRMRRRLDQLTGHGRARMLRKRKAKGFFESGVTAFGQGRWLEAAGSVRLAIAFDPGNEAYRERFVEVQRRAHEERAKQLVKQAEGALEMRDWREALTLFEEALHFRPVDAELYHRASRVAWQAVGELRKAKDLAASACELEPDNAGYRRTLGQVYAAAGLESNARRELEAAVRLDPKDKEARAALRAL